MSVTKKKKIALPAFSHHILHANDSRKIRSGYSRL